MEAVMTKLMDSDAFVLVIIGAVAVLITVARSVASVLKTQARERSRREIAAYIAEGSMSPEQGDRLMRSGETERG